MKTLWIVGGVLAGGRALGLPGAVLGGGLGFCLGALTEFRQRLERVEKGLVGESAPAPVEESRAERYPEEAIIDAMQAAEADEASRGTELEDYFDEVSGTKKKRLH